MGERGGGDLVAPAPIREVVKPRVIGLQLDDSQLFTHDASSLGADATACYLPASAFGIAWSGEMDMSATMGHIEVSTHSPNSGSEVR